MAPASELAAAPAAEEVQVEYVSAQYGEQDEIFQQFEDVFKRFATAEALTGEAAAVDEEPSEAEEDHDIPVTSPEERAAAEQKPDEDVKNLSRRKRKELLRMSIADLKQAVGRPEAVESHDVTAADPKLLVYLKSYRNAVPVPRHWCHKRRYLQGKRGVEKRPWQLPEFIAQTGTSRPDARGGDDDETRHVQLSLSDIEPAKTAAKCAETRTSPSRPVPKIYNPVLLA